MRTKHTIALFTAIAIVVMATSSASSTSALSQAEWKAGNIIDDSVFTDKNSMSVTQIQSWLDARLIKCDYEGRQRSEISGGKDYDGNGIITRAEYGRSVGNPAPFTCLNNYYEVPKTSPSQTVPPNNYGKSSIPKGAKSAAQLIYNAAQTHKINPKVLLVKLATESAGPLTGDTWPLKKQYIFAMGAHCPDSGPGGSANCDINYSGFSIQMLEAAKLMRWYIDSMDESWWSYRQPYKTNHILWNVAPSGCGGKNVYISNKATAALYTYTPYQPNAAALSNLYGTGDRCSAYGNRNFWRVYKDWFGSTRLPQVAYRLYDGSTDKTGETAQVGFALEKKPKAPVTIPIAISSRSNAEIVGGADSITISPENWDSPRANTVTITGKDNPNLTGSHEYTLITGKLSSNDTSFNQISAAESPDIPLVAQSGTPDPVYRLYSPNEQRHFFTADPSKRALYKANGWIDEGSRFYTCPAGSSTIAEYQRGNDSRLVFSGSSTARDLLAGGFIQKSAKFSVSGAGTTPVYRLYDAKLNRSLYTTVANEGASAGFINKGVAFYACEPAVMPIYRLKKPSGSHFYTASIRERQKAQFDLKYNYEQASFYVSTSSDAAVPVHRFLREDKGIRFYTTSEKERGKAASLGYRYEGVAFNVTPGGTTPVYRLYNKSNGRRLYTPSTSERDRAVQSSGFKYEGVGFTAQ